MLRLLIALADSGRQTFASYCRVFSLLRRTFFFLFHTSCSSIWVPFVSNPCFVCFFFFAQERDSLAACSLTLFGRVIESFFFFFIVWDSFSMASNRISFAFSCSFSNIFPWWDRSSAISSLSVTSLYRTSRSLCLGEIPPALISSFFFYFYIVFLLFCENLGLAS